METKYGEIPDLLIQGIRGHADDHRPVGSFLTAVLENNLTDAVCRADINSTRCLKAIVKYCIWEIPGSCWGSREKMDKWLESDNAK